MPLQVTTPVAPASVNDAKEVALTKELDKTTQAPTLFDTMIDTIIKKTDEINTVLTTIIANKPDVAIVTNNKEADDAKKLKDSDTVGSINTITGGMPTGNNVITTTPVGYTVKPAAAPPKQTGQVEGTSGQVTASDSSKLLAGQQKIEYDRFGKTIADLRKEAQAIGANGIDYIISQNLGTMTKAQLIENTKNYITSSYNQVALGNYAPEDVTLLGTSIQVLAGVLGVDLFADLRDVSADLINFKPTGDHALQTGVDAMGLIPLIGVGKYADEVATLMKRADDYAKAVDAPITIIKKADELAVVGKGVDGDKDDFIGLLKGEKISLLNVKSQVIEYTKVSTEKLADLRKAFNTIERKNFLKSLTVNDEMISQLKKAGLNDTDIQDLADGFVPDGYQVHHKIPLDGGGTNNFDNLILIQNDPYHMVITNTQKTLTAGLQAGDTITLNNWPMPEGFIYPTE